MGLDTKYIESPEAHHQHYNCGVCKELVDLDCLVTTTCSHVSCRRCLAKHFAVEKSCPTCKCDFKNATTQQQLEQKTNDVSFMKKFAQPLQLCQPLAYRVLQDCQVRCSHPRSLHCGWKGKYADLRLHLLSHTTAHAVNGTTTTATANNNKPRSNRKKDPTMQQDDVTETTGYSSDSASDLSWDDETSSNCSPIPPPTLPVQKSRPTTTRPVATKGSQRKSPTTIPIPSSRQTAPKAAATKNQSTAPATPRSAPRPAVATKAPAPARSAYKAPTANNHGSRAAPAPINPGSGRRSVAQICQHFKEEGNKHFLKNDYIAASGLYTRGINFLATRRSKSLDCENTTDLEATLLNNRAACWFALQDFQEAVVDSLAALKLDPTYEKASVRLARSYIGLGNFLAALKACQAACQRPAAPSAILKDLLTHCTGLNQANQDALLFVEEGHYEMAKKKVAMLLPHCQAPSVLLLAAQADLGSGNTDEVLSSCATVLEGQPQSTKALLLGGQATILAGQVQEGMQSIKEALRMDPDSGASTQAGKRWLQVGNTVQAVQVAVEQERWEDVLQLLGDNMGDCPLLPPQAPLFAILYTARAQAYHGTGKHETALKECARVFSKQTHARHADAWVVHLSAMYELGRYGEALEDVKRIQTDWGLNDSRFTKHHCKIEGALKMRPDFYNILGVSRTASDRELRKAYRLLSRKCHPDRFLKASAEKQKEAADQFQKLNEALEFLTDDFMRQQYDEGNDLKTIRQRAFCRSNHSPNN